MPKHTRFVRAEKHRLPLLDVHRAAHQQLITAGVLLPPAKHAFTDRWDDMPKAMTTNARLPNAPEKYRPATAEEIAASRARVEQAETDGDWIDVKKRLTAGEARHMYTGVIKGGEMRQGETPALDPDRVGLSLILTYLLGWSFQDGGEVIPYSVITMGEEERIAVLNSLDPETFQELNGAIEYHAAQMAAAQEQEKKVPITPSGSALIS